MNSPVVLRDPILTLMNGDAENYRDFTRARIQNAKEFRATADATAYLNNSRATARKFYPEIVEPSTLQRIHSPASQNPGQIFPSATEQGFDGLGGVAGILGAASTVAPILAPVAAAAGVGYGVYKLGHTFDLW